MLKTKYQLLLGIIREYGPSAVAFSGGVDSAFLLAAAKEALGGSLIALTADLHSVPREELTASRQFCDDHGIRQMILPFDELAVPGFCSNPPDRCYLCKKAVFSMLMETAAANGYTTLMEGTNADDTGDFRPGMQAINELGVRSPLKDAGLTKQEIRLLSQNMQLPTWNKPSLACLSTRIPYGETITAEKLRMAEQAEQILAGMGLRQVRVRIHGTIARIETLKEDFPLVLAENNTIAGAFRKLGFTYVALDLQGYRTGSLNEVLSPEQRNELPKT